MCIIVHPFNYFFIKAFRYMILRCPQTSETTEESVKPWPISFLLWFSSVPIIDISSTKSFILVCILSFESKTFRNIFWDDNIAANVLEPLNFLQGRSNSFALCPNGPGNPPSGPGKPVPVADFRAPYLGFECAKSPAIIEIRKIINFILNMVFSKSSLEGVFSIKSLLSRLSLID